MATASFLDVENFPKLRFESTKVEKAEGDRYRLSARAASLVRQSTFSWRFTT